MFIKLIGACMTIGACGAMGLLLAANYSNRPRELRQLRHALDLLETEVAFALSALPQAMDTVANQTEGICSQLFKKTAGRLSSGDAYFAGEAWCDVAREVYTFSSLCQPDLEVMLTFGKTLGTSDRDDQLKHLHLAKERLMDLERQAEEILQKNGRLCKYFGVSLGLVVVAILF